nr:type II toxin-antitoxin system RelE/ParE family toxin [uncultured Rhodopila sp.]
MIAYTPKAERQVDDLRRYYEDKDRPEAVRGLFAALAGAERKIEANPASGLPAPRPYPGLTLPGRAWIKAGRYWIAYRKSQPPTIVGVFYESADIPARL